MLFKSNPAKYDNIVIALCGIFQCAVLIDNLAIMGACDNELFEKAISTIFKIDAPTTLSIFEEPCYVANGARELLHIFRQRAYKKKLRPNVSRYALSTILCESQLRNRHDKMMELRKRIEQIQAQANYFSITHDQVISNLADLYLSLVSNFRFRIQIVGKAVHLQNPVVMEKIRALFLAALRAAVLWRQVGGRRWQLFFARRAYYQAMKRVFG